MVYNVFMKKVAVLYNEYSPVIDALKYYLSDCELTCLKKITDKYEYDLVISLGADFDGEALVCHPSLLPAFASAEPIKDAILSGVKVTGITVYFAKSKRIVAQYPVFIRNEIGYDELKQELKYVEQTFLPLIAKKLLNNEPIESAMLNNHCGGCCGGCGSCNH